MKWVSRICASILKKSNTGNESPRGEKNEAKKHLKK